MSFERFNPDSPEYKKREDLPEREQQKYTNVPEGGFVLNEAEQNQERAGIDADIHNRKRSLKDKILGRDKITDMDVLQEQANKMNENPRPHELLEMDLIKMFHIHPETYDDAIPEFKEFELKQKTLLYLREVASDAANTDAQLVYKVMLVKFLTHVKDPQIEKELHLSHDEIKRIEKEFERYQLELLYK